MKYTNYRKLDKVEFLYPEWMSKDAEARLRKLFEQIQLTKELLWETVQTRNELQQELEELEKKWAKMSSFAKITFAEEEKDEIKETVHLGFNFGTEINNNLH